MNILGSFQVRNALLALALLFPASVGIAAYAQDPGDKPEMMADMHPAKPKVRSTELRVILGDKVLTLSPSDLAAMPHDSVTVTNGHTKAAETYSGVQIAAILAKLGLPFEKANEHTLLRTILIAEGTDGYKSIFSTYETLAAIRGQGAIIADTLGGKPLDKDGVFKMVITGDTRPQRWVQNLQSITFETIE